MKMSHYFGGILLVAGTTIGAGMLALPVMTSYAGFFPSLVIFIVCWAFMLASAFFFLDVNLSFKGESNLISMSGQMLGPWGKGITWIFYLLLLYALTAAYIAGSTPLFADGIGFLTGYTPPHKVALFSLPLLFGSFVYLGTQGVDYINRILMVGLGTAFFLLIAFIPSHIDNNNLLYQSWGATFFAVPVVITSFGYHIIIPSLTTYLKHDAKALRKVIMIGSLLPLGIYFVWQWLTLGSVPLHNLQDAYKLGQSATEPLSKIIQTPWISVSARYFSFFAIVTSFLGVSLSLADFLIDGLKIKKSWEGRLMACALTFIPPIIFVLSYERGFILALQYAGAFVAILLIFLPAAMAWKLKKKFYQSAKGRALMLLVMLFAVAIILIDIFLH